MAKTKIDTDALKYQTEQDDLRNRAKAAAYLQAKLAGDRPGLIDEAAKKAESVYRANAARALAQTAASLGNRMGGGVGGVLEQAAKTQSINQSAIQADAILNKNAAEQEAAATKLDALKFDKEAGSPLSDIVAGKNEAEAFLQGLANKYADADFAGDFDGEGFRGAAEAYANTVTNPIVRQYVLSRIHPIIKAND